MYSLKIEIRKHKLLSNEYKNEIIKLKNQHWKYTLEEHRKWLSKNLMPEDMHLLIWEGGGEKLLAYLNIVHTDVFIDQDKIKMLGIGNVCVSKGNMHLGLGAILMAVLNAYLSSAGLDGILLCKDKLINFYEKAGWMLLKADITVVHNSIVDHKVMIKATNKNINLNPYILEVSKNF